MQKSYGEIWPKKSLIRLPGTGTIRKVFSSSGKNHNLKDVFQIDQRSYNVDYHI